MTYQKRLRRYEEGKQYIRATAKDWREYEKRIKALADKLKI